MANQNINKFENPVVPWWLVLIEGIAAIILGILLFLRPAATMIMLIQFLGIYWLITGIFSIVSLFWDRSAWGWKLFNGILGILAGILIIQNPLWSTLLVPATLAIVLGIIGMMIGILQLMEAFRGGGWGIGVLGGLSILLGLLLITRPVLVGLTLPWILGFLLIAGGILALFAAFALRKIEQQARQARSQAATRAPSADLRKETAGMPAAGGPVAQAGGAAAGAGRGAQIAAGAAAAGAVEMAATSVVEAQKPVESVSDQPSAAAESAAEVVQEAGEAIKVTPAEAVAAGEVAERASESLEEAGEAASRFAGDISDAALTGNVDLTDPAEMAKFKYELEYVEGIGPAYGAQLKAIGLVTCLDLLKAGASRKGREEIVAKSGISSKLILEWVNHLDLYRIKGVGSEYADLLEAAGVDTVVELAQRNPGNLFEKMNAVNAEKALVRKLPTTAQVEDWVSQAKGLARVVTY
jgi:uncharacterized membrane protein HdeD (DUF308 family)/predicted flap endonuclease-1-like 5' DNA nuclease